MNTFAWCFAILKRQISWSYFNIKNRPADVHINPGHLPFAGRWTRGGCSGIEVQDYIDFLESKVKRVNEAGFNVDHETLNKNLFDFQRYIVAKAAKMGKYAVFADCGLGKTLMQLEWSRLVSEHTQKPVIILCPLAVAGQTIDEGVKFGINVERLRPNISGAGVYITNYDQLDNVNASLFYRDWETDRKSVV